MKISNCFFALGLTFLLSYCIKANANESSIYKINVVNNQLESLRLPEISFKVNDSFRYLGSFDFTLDGKVSGERHIFVESRNNQVTRLFIAQFEHFLPTSEDIYRYSFQDALEIKGHKFKQNTFAYNNHLAVKNKPKREAALTAQFLERQGLSLPNELMLSRYVALGDQNRKSELILFYAEDVAQTPHSINDFYIGDEKTVLWKILSEQLAQRALESFTIID